MRKALFIGCGVILLIIVGGLGFLGWTFYGPIKAIYDQWEVDQPRFAALEDRFPFDVEAQTQLHIDRFTTHLDLRVSLVNYARALELEIDGALNDDSIGFIDQLRAPFERIQGLTSQVATQFEEAGMSLSEFAYYSRVLWATLRNLDEGSGGSALVPLRGRYSQLRHAYEEATREQPDVPTLDEIIGTESSFPPDVLDTAVALLAQDTNRVLEGVEFLQAEPVLMQADGRDPHTLQDAMFPADGGSVTLEGR